MLRRIHPLVKCAAFAALFYAIFDGIVFRSGYYYRLVEPESISGSVVLNAMLAQQRVAPARNNVLVLGDSRIGEGFSARLANEYAAGTRLNFIGCGIPGSTPRVWRYFLRQVDSARNRYRAIVVMAAGFSEEERGENFADRSLDINYCLPLLNLGDLGTFPDSFSDQRTRARARQAIAFPLTYLQNDVRAWMVHPLDRMQKVRLWRHNYVDWIYDYPGHAESLLPSTPAPQVTRSPEAPADTADYLRQWYGDIAADYRDTGVPIYVFFMPRGPQPTEPVVNGSHSDMVAALSAGGKIHVLDPGPLSELETPENFFDRLHLNAVGRARLTRRLTAAIVAELH